MARGVVKFFHPEKGCGAPGDEVEFDVEPAHQDSFRFVATRVEAITR